MPISLTSEEEREIPTFLFGLHKEDDSYLSIDLTQKALSEKFSRFNEKQAFAVLCRLHDAELIALEDKHDKRGWRWIRGKKQHE